MLLLEVEFGFVLPFDDERPRTAWLRMLRHACGFKLANDGVDTRTIQAYLGHKGGRHEQFEDI